MTRDQNKRAIALAAARREGKTWPKIGRMFGMSAEGARQALSHGCPPFREPVQKTARPAWSYPDAITLAIVRAVRAEMQSELRQ